VGKKKKIFNNHSVKILILSIFIILLTEIISNIEPYENYTTGFNNSSGNYISNKDPDKNVLPFMRTTINETIFMIDVRTLSFDDRLTAVSLQGIVNKGQASVYLIYSDPELQWFEYLRNFTSNSIQYLDLTQAIERFSNLISGIVLYNDNHVSINLATTISGLENVLMVRTGGETYGFDVTEDTTKLERRSYFQLFHKYFDRCNRGVIAHFAGHDIKSRDYVIQQEMFCFYKEPGPFSWPDENLELMDMIEEFSNKGNGFNRLLFGWFQTPTITEEDYAIQLLSHYGVTLVPDSNTPNLSLLQAVNANLEISENNEFEKVVDKKVYITFGMADGDSLDFMYKNMNSFWNDPLLNDLPVSWSVNPLLEVIAPVVLKYYSETMAENHSFISGGSGMGVIFPDFFPPELLPNYIENSRSIGPDKVWLLNSYTPYETRYSENVLLEYAENYEGIVLDYGSVPVKNPYWKLGGKPFVRSLHYMGDDPDFQVKLGTLNTFSDKPLFLYITLFPWSDLDIPKMLDNIENICDNYEFVNLDQFFFMINDSSENLDYFDDTRRSHASTNQYDLELQDLMINEGWIILCVIFTVIIWLIISKKKVSDIKSTKPHLVHYIYYGSANTLYLSMVLWVLFQNYWQWLSLGIIPIIAIIYPFLRILRRKNVKSLDSETKTENYIFYGFFLGLSSVISVIFPIVLLIGFMAYFKIGKTNPKLLLKTYPIAIMVSFLISFLFWTTWILLSLCLFILFTATKLRILKVPDNKKLDDELEGPNEKMEQKIPSKTVNYSNKKQKDGKIKDFVTTFLPAAFFSILILPIFYLDMVLINVIMDYNSYLILILSILVIIIAVPLGIWLMKYYKYIRVLYPLSWLLIIAAPFSFILPLILLLIQAMTYCLAEKSYENLLERSKKQYQFKDFVKNLAYLPIIVSLFIIFPPMIFSVYFIKLNYVLFQLLYLKPVLFCLISLTLVIVLIVAEKRYLKNEKQIIN
jgi:hypothetical protein